MTNLVIAQSLNLVRSSASLQVKLPIRPEEKLQSVELNLQVFTRSIEGKPTLLTAH